MKHLILTCLLLLSVTSAKAFYYQDLEYYPLSNSECIVRGFDPNHVLGSDVTLVIPPVAADGEKEYTVTYIDKNAFSGYTQITDLYISSTVKSINDNAFSSCINLREAILPTSIQNIGEEAFRGCISMATLVTSAETIGAKAFSGCYSLSAVSLNYGVKYIEPGAFMDCPSLLYIDIPSTATIIGGVGAGVFENCSLLQTVTFTYNLTDKFPNLTRIGSNTFKNCINLQRLDFPYSLKYIGTDAFIRCLGLNHLEWGGPEKISVSSMDLTDVPLKRIVYHGDVTLSRSYDFAKLTKLAEVRYDKYATEVQGNLFADIPSLKEVHLDNISKIGYAAFKNCTSLAELTLPETLSMIEYGAFEGCTSLKSVTLPDALTVLENDIFSGCISLSSVKFGKNITTIQRSFNNCKGLNSFEIPMSVSILASACLDGCTALKNLTIGGPTTLDLINFAPNSPIEKLTLRGKVKGNLWESLKSVTFSDYCTEINSSNFNGCVGLTSIDFSHITSIGSSAFANCTGLRSADLSSVSTIGGYAFDNCTALREIKFGPLIKEIPSCMNNCGITSLVIPDNVTSFRTPTKCANLTNVKIGDGVTYVGAFDDCPNISEIWYGASVTEIFSGITSNVKKITSANPNPPRIGSFSNTIYQQAQLIVPTQAVKTYQNTVPWSNFTNIIGKDLTAVENIKSDDSVLTIAVKGGVASIESQHAISIYDISGRIVTLLSAGSHDLELSKGIYIIHSGLSVEKIYIK